MTKHTPGPWRSVEGGRHWNNPAIKNYRIHAPSGDRGFDVEYSDIGELVVEHVYEEADARLIAAAPDLLEALEAIVESGEIPYCYSSPLVLKAKAAIAKARGEPK